MGKTPSEHKVSILSQCNGIADLIALRNQQQHALFGEYGESIASAGKLFADDTVEQPPKNKTVQLTQARQREIRDDLDEMTIRFELNGEDAE